MFSSFRERHSHQKQGVTRHEWPRFCTYNCEWQLHIKTDWIYQRGRLKMVKRESGVWVWGRVIRGGGWIQKEGVDRVGACGVDITVTSMHWFSLRMSFTLQEIFFYFLWKGAGKKGNGWKTKTGKGKIKEKKIKRNNTRKREWKL